ncbi:RNA-guided pseudouridylation complex pseudouridine synthase subunit Cbf5 [Candidatus Woesearchaeota archaeon CG10_big_fil_rev_8_21_14_0_10_37_12]|nr:MAG: RNA-guided pseudouridylation complex pseudouridine synthase subunit Cbf5 [Candidatus Woesearchaeota archaeon CG10_big_fil_rev_8_21_14_0_10_37_12]
MSLLPFEQIQREVLTKIDATTNPKYGCKPEDRTTDQLINYGVINLNKPKGPTSHMVSGHIKKILKIDKAGHGGTLDPGVTGVLPVATGNATRVVQALLSSGKEYTCLMHLHKPVPEDKLKEALDKFKGDIMQLPPVRSAVKRQTRARKVYYLNILEMSEQDVLFRMGCQAGTYVRKLCHDVGQELGVGAHMAELIRTKAGPFNDQDWVTLQDLEDAFMFYKEENNDKFLRHCIKPVEFAVSHLPKIWVQDNAVDTICHGASLHIPGVAKLNDHISKGDILAIMTLKDELVCLAISELSSKEIMEKEKGRVVSGTKVFMQPGTYKKMGVSKV